MFNRLLVANRGEIACRVIRTARMMGIETIAIYSTADKDSLHVQQANKAYWIGESSAKASYLHIDAIIEAAIKSQAEAIHPGYGFLSENPAFASACAKAGIVFIGPSIEAMQAMASKQLAKQLLEKTGVPLTPGYHGSEQSDATLLKEARQLGFPVLLKAASGGGGKGMRAVHQEEAFAQALAGARREATASFGDDTMIIEKLLGNPRHIEIQIMADNHGNVVHLFERDCSIQRRHQKIIEEAPAPGLNDALRQQLAKSACEVARAIHYRGAGTVEFLVDGNERFYFMEMNTRLQVEHPVTEMITGLDLVAMQISIAADEPLSTKQHDIIAEGHAIECRIYAEDPFLDFIPSTGQLHFLKEPTGAGIRIDSGVTHHSIISQYYDPMIAKLIVHGPTRECALQRLQLALNQFAIGGVKSNIPFLQAICANQHFIAAELSTHFLQDNALTLAKPDTQIALLMAASFDYLLLNQEETDPIFRAGFAWQMHLSSQWSWRYQIENSTDEITITPIDSQQFKVLSAFKNGILKAHYSEYCLTIEDGEQIHRAWVENQPQQLTLYFAEGIIHVGRFRWQTSINQTTTTNSQLTAPMPATVVAILKKRDDVIKKGDPLLILEAMKMEHTIHAPKDGILAEFFYDIGQQVNEGAELLTINDVETT